MNLLKTPYRVIIFDFDNTLCNMNIFTSGIQLDDIDEKNKTVKIGNNFRTINTLFNDYSDLICIFTNLKCKGVKLVIASFGNILIITKLLNIAFTGLFDYIVTSDNIDEESRSGYVMKVFRHIVDPLCPRFYGKNLMIRTIMDKYNINNPHEVLFFDDDYSNATCSNHMKIHSHNNTRHGINSKLLMDTIFIKEKMSGGKRYVLTK
mgnify:CR=1 FL=1